MVARRVAIPSALRSQAEHHRYPRVYGYDPQGDQTSASTPPITTTLPGGQVQANAPVTTTYGYDGDGNQTGATSANGNTTTTGYDHLGCPISTTLPQVQLYDGRTVTPVEATGYDGDGNVVRSIDANGDLTTSSYDPLQRQVSTTNPVSGTSVMTYSATEQVASQDPQGHVTTSGYDGAGRLLSTTDPSGGVTQYQYDPQGNTVTISSTTTGGALSQLEVGGYNALNQVVTDTVGLPGQMLTTRTAYDYDGNVVQVGQPNGDTTFATYRLDDLLNTQEVDTAPVMTATTPPGSVESYSYDDAGQVISHDDFDGRVLYDSYDGDGRALQDVTYDPGGTPPMTTTTGYDPDGNALSQQVVTATAGSATTTSGYNAADWPITTTEMSSDGTSPLSTAYGYDAAGQQRSETILAGQTPVTTTLDADGRATSLAENADGTGPYTGTFGYYPTDLPMTASVPGGNGVTLGWTYDGSDRVTHAGLAGPDTGAVTTTLNSGYDYQYDPATGWTTELTGTVSALYGGQPTPQLFTHDAQGRLTRWQWPTQPNLDERRGYDGNGNVLTNHEYIDGQYRTTYYTYTASIPNELQAQHTEGLGVESYTYDHYGNTTSLSATDALTGTYGVSDTIGYDSHARPVSIRVKSQAYSTVKQAIFSTVSFGYNAQGQRSSYTVSTPGYPGYRASYRYRDDGPQVAQAVVASGTVTGTVNYTDTYLYDQGGLPYELLRQYQGQPIQRYWYEEDGQGDVVALTDVNGNVVDRYAYDPWGEGLAGTISEQVPQPLRYRGYWWDTELGWYWVNARSLDPEGRWLQPDPSQQDGVRTYAYLGDDPVDATDPTGQGPGSDPCTSGLGEGEGEGGGADPECATAAQAIELVNGRSVRLTTGGIQHIVANEVRAEEGRGGGSYLSALRWYYPTQGGWARYQYLITGKTYETEWLLTDRQTTVRIDDITGGAVVDAKWVGTSDADFLHSYFSPTSKMYAKKEAALLDQMRRQILFAKENDLKVRWEFSNRLAVKWYRQLFRRYLGRDYRYVQIVYHPATGMLSGH